MIQVVFFCIEFFISFTFIFFKIITEYIETSFIHFEDRYAILLT